jgi:2-polyprenyl-3-methyl-5-hydroxy-6-metoxy-1,4-benzoquinol methylase
MQSLQTIDESGKWRVDNEAQSPRVVRSRCWPHFALAVTASAPDSHGAWVSRENVGLLEEIATTFERSGVQVVLESPSRPLQHHLRRIHGRWLGWRNLSARSAKRVDGLASDGSVLSATLEVLGDSMPRYAEWLARNVVSEREQTILEVGAGTGTMTRVLARSNQITAFEPSQDARNELILRTKDLSNVRVIDDLQECGVGAKFDLVLLVNVLEHIQHDVQFLKELREYLTQNGRLVVLSPAHNCLYSRFDASIGHVRRYTRRTLRRTFEEAGYKSPSVRYFNAIGAILWLLVNRLLGRQSASAGQTRLYDSFIVPLSAGVDRMRIRPFGQSVIGSARR